MRKITTYERYDRHMAAWFAREIDPLLVAGPPGSGKSYSYEQALRETPHHLFRARRTPIKVYNELYDNPQWPVVFDDIVALLRDDNFLDLLKSLCEIRQVKMINWGTTTSKLEGRETSFRCTSRVLIIMNEMPTNRPDVMAVLDRCDAIHFAPTKKEIIARMHQAFPQDEALIGLLERVSVLPSLRTLIKARLWEQSKHLDLLEELMSECALPDGVHALIKIMTGHPEQEWCMRYVEETGLTDRSYRRHKEMAAQIVECRAPEKPCPNVRAGAGLGTPAALSDIRTADPEFSSDSKIAVRPATQVANPLIREAG